MALTPGTRLGPYEVTAQLGVGGMGEVHRARDTKLNRDVALKVLPETFIADAGRLARFKREAQVLAALNHPGIAAIYGFEDSSTTHALVMELVEGPTLADRLVQGPIALDEALPIAKQIAEALETAHEQAIIHRDLKPANIKVRDDGTVKVLDFGLAKALGSPGAASGAASVSLSPTLTTPAMTEMGMILGTAAYMAPEQARGRTVDRRADIWAFGVVLYEMLTGRRAFDGDDISITLASVLKEDVNWQALPADLPVPVRRLLRRCLEKDPKRRLSAIGDARLELDEVGGPADRDGVVASASAQPSAPVVPAWPRALPWALAGALAVGLMATLVMWSPWRAAPAPTPRKLLAAIGADASLPTTAGAAAILSPDGTMLAFVGLQEGQQSSQARLFVRKLDELQAAPLAGTEGAASPFFSPDGQWLAFFAGGKLKKVSVTGGAAIDLCDAPSGRGGTWADDDTIIFTPTAGSDTKLWRVPAAGGTPAAFGTLSQGATTQRWPQVLPGGKAVLYTESSSVNDYDAANLVVAPLAGGAPKVVVRGGYYGRYAPSGLASPKRGERPGGHLVYLQQGTLFAVPFDLVALETIGPAVPVIQDLMSNPNTAGAQLALSSDGTLVYVPGAAVSLANPIDWVTRDGKSSVLRATKSRWMNPHFSPDGRKLALTIDDGKHRNIWVYEWARDTMTQLTFGTGDDDWSVWTPDGRRIVFASDRAKVGTRRNLYWVNADGTGEVTRLTDSPDDQFPTSWDPTGKFLAFSENRGASSWDLMILPMDGDAARGWTPGTPTVFLGTPATEAFPMFSPDGRFIAYTTNEAGAAYDTYVRPFPGPGGKWRVSTNGGGYPHWSATAQELLFKSPDNKVMFAPYAVAGDSFRADKPEVWSPTELQVVGTNYVYDLHPDGKRIVGPVQQQTVVQDKVVFVFNFADYLRRVAPPRK